MVTILCIHFFFKKRIKYGGWKVSQEMPHAHSFLTFQMTIAGF